MMYANEMTNHVINSSVNATLNISNARALHMTHRRRTQSLEVNPTVPSMSMTEVFPGRGYYSGDAHSSASLPTSPSASSLECFPAQPNPEFLPSLVVDGHPHPFFVPMSTSAMTPTLPTTVENDQTSSASPSPTLSASLSTSFQSNFSSTSACTSPSLSSPSPTLNRKRCSTDSVASSVDSQCHSSNVYASCGSRTTTTMTTGGPIAKKAKQRYICHVPNCNRTFSRPYNLKSHGLTHDTHRPYACNQCSKSFARIHDRDRHMNSHMAQKPHVCIVCQGRFARQDAVIRHLKLSNETNACSWILKTNNISFRDAAAGRVSREALGEESKIIQTLETLEEHARKARATRTLELMGAVINNNSNADTSASAADRE
ncbi:hypothetical protein BGX26_012211 [Mortierella sp. AD094]|nr:hypothetical protein BGX26_012211 [Mortierella sp. AD094]